MYFSDVQKTGKTDSAEMLNKKIKKIKKNQQIPLKSQNRYMARTPFGKVAVPKK